MSFWASNPRLGTLPSALENVRVSVVRLSSRTFSLGGWGGGGATGLGKVVVVGGPLLGRKIVLKPVPPNSPMKCERTPSGGGAAAARAARASLISSKTKLPLDIETPGTGASGMGSPPLAMNTAGTSLGTTDYLRSGGSVYDAGHTANRRRVAFTPSTTISLSGGCERSRPCRLELHKKSCTDDAGRSSQIASVSPSFGRRIGAPHVSDNRDAPHQ